MQIKLICTRKVVHLASFFFKVRVNFWNSEVAYYGMMSHTLFKVTKVLFLACTLERKWKLGKIGHRKIKS